MNEAIRKEVELQMQNVKREHQKSEHAIQSDKRCLTAVIGNLEGLKTLARAQAWLFDKLKSLDGPAPRSVYDKGGFRGTVFADFTSHEERDLAVALLRSAGVEHEGKRLWATQDRAPAERAARNFCYSLKNLFKNVWEIPYLAHVMDGLPYTVRVGGDLAVTAHVQQNDVLYEWHGEWATWKELQDSSELKELMRKSDELVARTSRGMKGGKASGKGPFPH